MPPHPAHAGLRYQPHTSSSRREIKPVNQADLDALPSMDNPTWYDPPSPSSSTSSIFATDEVVSPHVSNARNKLEFNSRWMRKGKMCAWGPSYEEAMRKQRARKRLQLCLEQLLPESAADVGVAPPQNVVEAEDRRRKRKRDRQEDKEYLLPHLRSPSPPISTLDLAPMLALPRTYLDIVTSPAMRYSLGNDSMERGLQKTAADLLEGEKGLMQALGRLREVIRVRERDVPDGPASNGYFANGSHSEAANGDSAAVANGESSSEEKIGPLPHVSDTDNLWRVTQELLQAQPPPSISFTVTPPGAAVPTSPSGEVQHPTPIHRLFTRPSGITFNAIPNPQNPLLTQLQPSNPHYPHHVKYNLDLPTQQRAVDDAIERIMELLADCNEYKERLEEARERVGDVARVRKFLWKTIKRRAGRELDKLEGKNTAS